MEFFSNLHVSMFLLTCLILPYAHGLQCYVCNTVNESEQDCESIPEGSTKYLQNCTENMANSCRIQWQWVDHKVLNQTHGKRTIRQCGSDAYDSNKPCYYKTGYGGKVSVCHCGTDACNEAYVPVASLIAIALSLLLTVKIL